MLDLVIAACLAVSGECRDFHLLYDARDVSLMMCVAGGQVEIVDWQQSHPSWTVRRWRCGYQGQAKPAAEASDGHAFPVRLRSRVPWRGFQNLLPEIVPDLASLPGSAAEVVRVVARGHQRDPLPRPPSGTSTAALLRFLLHAYAHCRMVTRRRIAPTVGLRT